MSNINFGGNSSTTILIALVAFFWTEFCHFQYSTHIHFNKDVLTASKIEMFKQFLILSNLENSYFKGQRETNERGSLNTQNDNHETSEICSLSDIRQSGNPLRVLLVTQPKLQDICDSCSHSIHKFHKNCVFEKNQQLYGTHYFLKYLMPTPIFITDVTHYLLPLDH